MLTGKGNQALSGYASSSSKEENPLGTVSSEFSLLVLCLFYFLPDSSQQEHIQKGCPYRKSEIQWSSDTPNELP